MRKHRLLAVLLMIALTATTALAGCGKPKDQASGDQGKIDADQTFKIVGYNFSSLDSAAESDAESFTTYAQVFEGLYRETPDGNKPALAEKTDVSDDGLTYTFTIKDAKWSDGKPVTAHDFEFAWKRLIEPEHDYAHFIDMVKGAPEFIAGTGKIEDVGIKATDDKTLVVNLSSPTPYFTSLLSFAGLCPQREDVFKSLGENYGQAWDKIVYNGPFTITEYAKDGKIVYTKNPSYWDAANVKLQKAECPIINEPATLIQMFQSKELDYTGASGDNIAMLDQGKDAGGYNHITGTDGSVFYIIFNMQNPVFKSIKVRQALIAAFDKKAFLDTAFKRNIVAGGIVAPNITLGDKKYREIDGDMGPQLSLVSSVSDPKALMAEGLKDEGITDPSKVKLKLLMGAQSSLGSTIAQFTQQQFESKLGIKVEIVFSADNPAYFDARTKGQFDLCQGGWGPDYNDVSTYFGLWKTGDGNNNGKWSNAEFDKLIDQGAAELDHAKRLEEYQKAEKILVADDPAFITTYYRDIQGFQYNYVKNLFLCTFSGYYVLKDVYIQGRQ